MNYDFLRWVNLKIYKAPSHPASKVDSEGQNTKFHGKISDFMSLSPLRAFWLPGKVSHGRKLWLSTIIEPKIHKAPSYPPSKVGWENQNAELHEKIIDLISFCLPRAFWFPGKVLHSHKWWFSTITEPQNTQSSILSCIKSGLKRPKRRISRKNQWFRQF